MLPRPSRLPHAPVCAREITHARALDTADALLAAHRADRRGLGADHAAWRTVPIEIRKMREKGEEDDKGGRGYEREIREGKEIEG